MLWKLRKTIKAKIFALTKSKLEKLAGEYWNFQLALKGQGVDLYSATKQQAQRLLARVRGEIQGEHPLIIRRDVFKVKKQDTRLSRFWAKVPCYGGSIWVPVQLPHNQECLLGESIRETKLVRRKNEWFLHITVEKDIWVEIPANPLVLAVDFGERHIATSVEWSNGALSNPRFHGTEVRGIRRHYAWLRKRLGEAKCLNAIEKVGGKERRRVDAVLHNISRAIVDRAREIDAVIVLGSPNGRAMRRQAKGRRFRRIVYSMPYYRLSQFIEYKAIEAGVIVVHANEDYTSRECHRCGELAKRPRQDLVICPNGHSHNADLNAAVNIAKRFCEHALQNGAVLTQPKSQANRTWQPRNGSRGPPDFHWEDVS